MYTGKLTDEYKDIIFCTLSKAPMEVIYENFRDFKSEDNYFEKKPHCGLWGSFHTNEKDEPINLEKDKPYPWETSGCNPMVYNNGFFVTKYKLPEDCKVLIFDVETDFDYIKSEYGDWKSICSKFDAIIQMKDVYPYDVPSVCITNKKTFEKLQIEDFYYKKNFYYYEYHYPNNTNYYDKEEVTYIIQEKNNALEKLDECGYLLKYLDEDLKNNFDICKRAVSQNPFAIKFIGEKLKNNKELANIAMDNDIGVYFGLSDELKVDKDIYTRFINNKSAYYYFNKLPIQLQEDRDFVLDIIKKHGETLEFVIDDFKKDYEICLEAVKQDGYAYEFIDEKFKDDFSICLKAVKKGVFIFRKFPNKIKENETICSEYIQQGGFLSNVPEKCRTYDVCLEAVKRSSFAIYNVPISLIDEKMATEAIKNGYSIKENREKNFQGEDLKNNYYICLASIKENSENFENIGYEMSRNYNLCLEAVKRNGLNLKWVSFYAFSENDYNNIAFEAIKQNPEALKFEETGIKHNKDAILQIINNNDTRIISFISKQLKEDEDIIFADIEKYKKVNGLTDSDIIENKEVLIDILKENGLYIKFIENSKRDEDICLEAFKNNKNVFEYIPKELKINPSFCLKLVDLNIEILKDIDENIIKNSEFLLKCIDLKGKSVFDYLPKKIISDKEVALDMMSKQIKIFDYLNDNLTDDEDIIRESLKMSGISLSNASERLRNNNEFVLDCYKEYKKVYLYETRFKNIDFIKDLKQSKENNNLDTFKEDYPYYFRNVLENLNDDSLSFKFLLKSITIDDLMFKKVRNSLIDKFSQYECAQYYDLESMRNNPEQCLETLKGINFDEQTLIKDISLEQNNAKRQFGED